MLLAQSVISAREKLKLTQQELAELSGVSLRSIREIEASRANPGIQQLNKILDSLGLQLTIVAKSA